MLSGAMEVEKKSLSMLRFVVLPKRLGRTTTTTLEEDSRRSAIRRVLSTKDNLFKARTSDGHAAAGIYLRISLEGGNK
jgi:hypothetical protein